jgi:uncharacterized protein (DUF2235 family)
MPELVATLKAMYESENRKNKFLAMVNGIDMENSSDNQDDDSRPATFQEIQARAMAKLTGDTTKAKAVEYGITPDMGLTYQVLGDVHGGY